MKKLAFYMSLIVTGLLMVACNEDFKDWTAQQAYLPEGTITIPGYTASAASATGIDLNAVEGETVQLLNLTGGALPEGYLISGVRAYVVPADDVTAEPVVLKALDAEGNFSKAELQETLVQFFGPRPTARTFKAHIYADAVKDGQGALIDAGQIDIILTPIAPQISDNYYLVGGPNDWKESAVNKMLKFSHSGKDVYEDPVFTVVFPASAGDTWFAFGDDEACEAIANDDWSKLFGTTGESTDVEGSFDFRYNLDGDHSFCVKEGAKFIKVTLNMMDRTYKIETVNISDTYYLIGGPGNWDNSKNQKFSHSDKSVFDDPIFTYVFAGSGSEMWFAFGDDEAIDAVGDNVWNKLFGTTGASEDLKGSFDRRYNLDGDHSFHVDGLAKFYRFTINVMEMTYEITPLNFQEYIYEAGVNNDWGAVEQPLYCANQDGVYVGCFYAQDADWSGGKGAFKFTGAFNSWNDGNYGTGTINDDGLSGTLIDDGGSGNVLAEPGFYRAEVDLAAMTYKLTSIASIGIIGPAQAGSWDVDTDMTYNKETRAWEATVELAADEFKFRANDGWDINWGGSFDNLKQNGDNLRINEAGTYFIQFFPLCETKSYCIVTKK